MIPLQPKDIPRSERDPLVEEARNIFGDKAAEELRERFRQEPPSA